MGLNVREAKTAQEIGQKQFVRTSFPLVGNSLLIIGTDQQQEQFFSALLPYYTYLIDFEETAKQFALRTA